MMNALKPVLGYDNGNFFEIKKLYSVEFSLEPSPCLFQFKLRHRSSGQVYIIIDEKSDTLSHLSEGDIMEMNYYRIDDVYPKKCATKIMHITKDNSIALQGYYVVELHLLDDERK